MFKWSQNLWKFLAFSFEFHKFLSITRTIFFYSRSEQFWQQNTISICQAKINFLIKSNKEYYLASCSSWQAWAKSFSNASFSMSSILDLILGSSIELEIILAFQKPCSLLNFSFSIPHKGNFSCKTVMTGFGTVAGYLEPASR